MRHDTIGRSTALYGDSMNARVHIRCLDEGHLGDFERLLLGLDRAARFAWFGYVASDCQLAAHARTAMTNGCGVPGAFCEDELLGVLESYDTGGLHEVALVVGEPWRRCGLGWNLLNAASERARQVQAQAVRLVFHRHHWPMRRLVSWAEARFDLSFNAIVARISLHSGAKLANSTPSQVPIMTGTNGGTDAAIPSWCA